MKTSRCRQRFDLTRQVVLIVTLALAGTAVAAPTAEAQSRGAEGRRGEAVAPRRPATETRRPGARFDRPGRVRRVDRPPIIRMAPARVTDGAVRDRHRWSHDSDRDRWNRGRDRHRWNRERGRFFGSYGRRDRAIRVPLGAIVLLLPRHHEVVRYRGERLFYHQGTFYRPHRHRRGYVVVPAPHGVEVPYLPDGYTEVWRDGVLYYHSHGVHYRPIRRLGLTFFLSVRP